MSTKEEQEQSQAELKKKLDHVAAAGEGQAFPIVFDDKLFVGITKRDYFAAAAAAPLMEAWLKKIASGAKEENEGSVFTTMATGAFLLADAMLAAGEMHVLTPAQSEVIATAADRAKDLLNDPRNVIVSSQAILLWNSETQLRAMVEAV